MINIDSINKNNLITDPFEYMCIDCVDTDFLKSA